MLHPVEKHFEELVVAPRRSGLEGGMYELGLVRLEESGDLIHKCNYELGKR